MVVKHENNDNIYLRDVANISFSDSDTTSYARQNGQPVVMLDIKKRAGENIINAIDKLKVVVKDLQENFPADMNLTYTNDQSVMIRSQVSNLENSIVFGVILVVFVLLFSLGLRKCIICWYCNSIFYVFVVYFIAFCRSKFKYYGSLFISFSFGNAG